MKNENNVNIINASTSILQVYGNTKIVFLSKFSSSGAVV